MNGIGRRTASPYTDYHARNAELLTLLLPDSWVATAGTVTSITNHGQLTPTIAIAGSPALGSATGPTGIVLNGVDFDGVSDVITLTGFSASDDGLTVLALFAPHDANNGDRGTIIEFTDGSTTVDRSMWMLQVFTSIAAQGGQNGNSTASFAYNSTSLALFRGTCTKTSRSIHQDGMWKGSNAASCAPARTVTKATVGLRPNGAKPLKGVLCALVIWVGVPTDREVARAEGALLDMAGITRPWSWNDIGAVSVPSDPVWLVDGTVIHALVGEPCHIYKYNVALVAGDCDIQARVLTAGKYFDRPQRDRWSYTPTVAGDTLIEFKAGAHTATATIRAVVAPVGQPALNVWCLGDSRINRAHVMEIVKTRLGSQVLFVGNIGPQSNYTQTYTAHDSWTTVYYTRQSGDGAGTPSDLYNGGSDPDVAGLFLTFSAIPDVVVINLGQNDRYNAGSLAASIALEASTIIPNLETIIGWCRDAVPDIPVLLCLGEPLAADPALWSGTRNDVHERMHRGARAMLDHTWPAGVHLIPGWYLTTDADRAYRADNIHTSARPGHEAHASALIAALAAHVY